MDMISVQSIKKPLKKCRFYFTKDTFSMYDTWIKDFFIVHNRIYEFIGDNLENFFKMFNDKFFSWLNDPKNSSKFMFEIRKEFMAIADEVLIYEIMIERFKKSENKFVIPVLEKNSKSESDSEADIDIDYYSDPEPCYNLMEEKQQVLQEYTSEIESSNYDDEFYMSFFVKN